MEASSRSRDKGDTVWRGLAVLLFVALAFGCAVMIVSMVDINQTPTCHDVQFNGAVPNDGQCFSGTSAQKTIGLVLGFPGGVIAGVAGVLAVLFAITGMRGRLTVGLAATGVALSVLSIVIGSA